MLNDCIGLYSSLKIDYRMVVADEIAGFLCFVRMVIAAFPWCKWKQLKFGETWFAQHNLSNAVVLVRNDPILNPSLESQFY